MNSPAISLTGISKSYGTLKAVDDLSLTVAQGSVYGFLGPNGSGKTTTLRMIVNMLVPDSGSVAVLGEPCGSATQDKIGYLPEERGLYPKMKIGDLLVFFAQLKNVPRAEAFQRSRRWLERVGLAEWQQKMVNELSKGMQQKIQFIVAVIANPPVLILDEPTSGLDPVNANLLREILLELRRDGKTILFSTHRMEDAERLCDHVCLINRGHKVLDGELTQIRAAAGKSAIRVEYSGDVSILRRAPGVAGVDDYGHYAELRLSPSARAPEILRFLAPQLEISRFELIEPTLNQIFLEKVGEPAHEETIHHLETGVSATR
jgi:ABC-2 type transport system ATP-binding protein